MNRRVPDPRVISPLSFRRTQQAISGQIAALDGLRGIAVLMVIVIHSGQGWPVTTAIDWLPKMAAGFGWAGVDLFFVLSGFLITGILIDTRAAPNYFRAFYARRFLRIFPLYYAFLAGWFLAAPILIESFGFVPTVDFGTARAAWHWAYLANWLPLEQSISAIQYVWSLAVEEQFYLVWPVVVLAVPGRRLGWVCLAMAAAAFGVRYGLLREGVSWYAVYATTPARMDTLALGALVAVAVRDERWHDLLARLCVPVGSAAAAGTLVVFALARGPNQWHPLVQTWGYSLIAIAFAGLLGHVVLRGARWLEHPVLRSFGRYSYGIYVLQGVAFLLLSSLLVPEYAHLLRTRLGFFALNMVAGIALAYAMAWASWNLLEKHFLSAKKYFVAERAPRGVSSDPGKQAEGTLAS